MRVEKIPGATMVEGWRRDLSIRMVRVKRERRNYVPRNCGSRERNRKCISYPFARLAKNRQERNKNLYLRHKDKEKIEMSEVIAKILISMNRFRLFQSFSGGKAKGLTKLFRNELLLFPVHRPLRSHRIAIHFVARHEAEGLGLLCLLPFSRTPRSREKEEDDI